ncbi:MAG: DUF3110 domain-containing protein [Cyanobacteriota bacterium]
MSERVHVLLFDAGSDSEGIHSLELAGRTVVLLFEEEDDALRYAGLLEAQDFPAATVEALSKDEMETFCASAGYEARLVPAGFVPGTAEERLLLAPPERNLDLSHWKDDEDPDVGDHDVVEQEPDQDEERDPQLEAFRRSLEGLL